MKKIILSLTILYATIFLAFGSEEKDINFIRHADWISSKDLAEIAVQSHGRVKPLQTHARETILYLTGKYSMWGLDALQWYVALPTYKDVEKVPFINIRDPNLRVKLGFTKLDRFFSLAQLDASSLEAMARPIMQKLSQNDHSVTEDEKNISELMQQVWVAKSILSGEHFLSSASFDQGENSLIVAKGRELLTAIAQEKPDATVQLSHEMRDLSKTHSQASLISLEVFYNAFRPFFWAGLIYFLCGIALVIGIGGVGSKFLKKKRLLLLLIIPFTLHAAGFALRVWITGFAPVTNMYGTMVWMAFGIVLFGGILYALYSQTITFGLLLCGAGAALLLTESIPLILSPDLDPIVAVLRNNFWLTIHVLTITISYAAFTISMLIGNTALIRVLLKKAWTGDSLKAQAHLAYRAIQLGVFLLTVGIILGGWWADYSWGRFWGWDPKETWALIADLGFLAILHAKYLGWLGSFGILAAAPMSYLLVIMAWYGVNFILASGLHSYGFSSGGAAIVFTMVTLQIIIFTAAMLVRRKRKKSKAS